MNAPASVPGVAARNGCPHGLPRVAFSGCPGEVKVSAPAYLIIFGDTLLTKGWVTERGRHKGTLFIADGEEGEKVIMLGGQPRYHPWGCGRE